MPFKNKNKKLMGKPTDKPSVWDRPQFASRVKTIDPLTMARTGNPEGLPLESNNIATESNPLMGGRERMFLKGVADQLNPFSITKSAKDKQPFNGNDFTQKELSDVFETILLSGGAKAKPGSVVQVNPNKGHYTRKDGSQIGEDNLVLMLGGYSWKKLPDGSFEVFDNYGFNNSARKENAKKYSNIRNKFGTVAALAVGAKDFIKERIESRRKPSKDQGKLYTGTTTKYSGAGNAAGKIGEVLMGDEKSTKQVHFRIKPVIEKDPKTNKEVITSFQTSDPDKDKLGNRVIPNEFLGKSGVAKEKPSKTPFATLTSQINLKKPK